MNSKSFTYQPSVFTGLTNHVSNQSEVMLLRDGEAWRRSTSRQEIEARVRSGDYFVTLATTLDALSSDIDDYAIRAELEDVVSDLIYLQDNYTIAKNEPGA